MTSEKTNSKKETGRIWVQTGVPEFKDYDRWRQIDEAEHPFTAIVDSGVSRLRPVSMAALTTVLGMIPLVADAFFASMAVTIMFGLAFATVLTLVCVPVLYACFFRIPTPSTKNDD